MASVMSMILNQNFDIYSPHIPCIYLLVNFYMLLFSTYYFLFLHFSINYISVQLFTYFLIKCFLNSYIFQKAVLSHMEIALLKFV
jgi:hypothetical protein